VGQETYSLPATAPQVAIVDAARVQHNVDICERNGLAANCTQAQVDAAPSPKQGGTIYADSLAGRQAYVRSLVIGAIPAAAKDAGRKFRWAGLTQTQRDAYCASLGESAGCDPFAR
jgi:hypothetical protein